MDQIQDNRRNQIEKDQTLLEKTVQVLQHKIIDLERLNNEKDTASEDVRKFARTLLDENVELRSNLGAVKRSQYGQEYIDDDYIMADTDHDGDERQRYAFKDVFNKILNKTEKAFVQTMMTAENETLRGAIRKLEESMKVQDVESIGMRDQIQTLNNTIATITDDRNKSIEELVQMIEVMKAESIQQKQK